MKLNEQLRTAAPSIPRRGGPAGLRLVRRAYLVASALVFVVSALVVGATFAVVATALPTTVPLLLAGWVAAIGLTFALPLVVVRGVVTALERTE